MSHHPDAIALRRRASDLRRLAWSIEQSPIMSLERRAGPTTWQMPKASLCEATLATNQQQLHCAAEELREQSWRDEHRANELDAMSRPGYVA